MSTVIPRKRTLPTWTKTVCRSCRNPRLMPRRHRVCFQCKAPATIRGLRRQETQAA